MIYGYVVSINAFGSVQVVLLCWAIDQMQSIFEIRDIQLETWSHIKLLESRNQHYVDPLSIPRNTCHPTNHHSHDLFVFSNMKKPRSGEHDLERILVRVIGDHDFIPLPLQSGLESSNPPLRHRTPKLDLRLFWISSDSDKNISVALDALASRSLHQIYADRLGKKRPAQHTEAQTASPAGMTGSLGNSSTRDTYDWDTKPWLMLKEHDKGFVDVKPRHRSYSNQTTYVGGNKKYQRPSDL